MYAWDEGYYSDYSYDPASVWGNEKYQDPIYHYDVGMPYGPAYYDSGAYYDPGYVYDPGYAYHEPLVVYDYVYTDVFAYDVTWTHEVVDHAGAVQSGTEVADALVGGGGPDTLFGGKASDVIFAGGGDDIAFGGRGYDQLFGESGWDLLAGDRGNDTLEGGSGGDLFIYERGFGQDVITDFDSGEGDQLLLRDLHITDLVDTGGGLRVELGADGSISLLGVHIGELGSDWFATA